MDTNHIYEERLNRILNTVRLKHTDRVPVMLEYAGFAAKVTNTIMAEFISSYQLGTEVMIHAYEKIGEGDAINYAFPGCYGLGALYMSKVKIPGLELPEDDEWQVHESELMTRADYDLILELGWPDFSKKFLAEKVYKDAKKELLPQNQETVDSKAMWKKIGVPVLSGGAAPGPIELICGARSLLPFVNDQFKIPDKLEKVFEEMIPHLAKSAIEYTRECGYSCTWVMGCRSAPAMMSSKMWDRWVWPYFKHIVNEIIAAGQIPLLHLDSDWTRELSRFKAFPPESCILALDGETDIFMAKKVLDGHMCIQGDVPARMLAFGQPEDVTKYAKKLIGECGPTGFILHSGCDIPANAKLENVQAMVRAAIDE